MKPLTEERVFAIADELVRSLSGEEPYRLFVHNSLQQPRLIMICWDSLVEREDRRFASRGTVVGITDTEDMVRYRVRAMFANDAHLTYVGLYEVRDFVAADDPNEPPPYEVNPT